MSLVSSQLTETSDRSYTAPKMLCSPAPEVGGHGSPLAFHPQLTLAGTALTGVLASAALDVPLQRRFTPRKYASYVQ